MHTRITFFSLVLSFSFRGGFLSVSIFLSSLHPANIFFIYASTNTVTLTVTLTVRMLTLGIKLTIGFFCAFHLGFFFLGFFCCVGAGGGGGGGGGEGGLSQNSSQTVISHRSLKFNERLTQQLTIYLLNKK